MPMQQSNNLVLLSCISPILYGIYENGKLIQSFQTAQKTLNVLSEIQLLIKAHKIKRIFYARGPGNFTAIKLTHLFLQTLQIAEDVELFCVDSFYFNANAPIKAFGNQYFIKEEEILLKKFEVLPTCEFALPQILFEEDFKTECEPLYVLPAV